MKTPTNTGLYKVVANGAVSIAMSKASAERVAKKLRSGSRPVMATVIAARLA